MNILITGSTGFFGRHLIPKLLTNNNILEITRNISTSEKLYGNSTSKLNIGENHDHFVRIIQDFKPEIVIHLASYLTPLDDYINAQILVESNILFLTKILDSVARSGIKLFINTGSFSEYSTSPDKKIDPAYLYAATKTASRSFLRYYSKTYNFKELTVIPYTVYGGIDSQKKILDYIFDSINSNEGIDMSPGFQKLDFIHIDDIIALYLHLVENYNDILNQQVIHAGTGKGSTLRQVAENIEHYTGKKCKINWGAKDYRSNDIINATANINQNKDITLWKANIKLEEGIKKFIELKK